MGLYYNTFGYDKEQTKFLQRPEHVLKQEQEYLSYDEEDDDDLLIETLNQAMVQPKDQPKE
eukprot:CAMPEP_0116872982 /NCGR_PEP_ID=MMETSP0463-20121206/3932_1 /TAXON_ID=181622 /ORGANISM="Strombidinopsis sp, Strain SopsisLIS2011" /LENGTH=60 /DNA_ID=CAMNT_0004514147 /DNA_START=1688 /DNA_END=1870 /DNA_ORIENTATION=-